MYIPFNVETYSTHVYTYFPTTCMPYVPVVEGGCHPVLQSGQRLAPPHSGGGGQSSDPLACSLPI